MKNKIKQNTETRIIAFPYSGISYIDSFYSSISAKGFKVVKGDTSGSWLLKNVRRSDVIHLHWPSFMYEVDDYSIINQLRSFSRFVMILTIMRLKTNKIFWTAHNLLPHTRSIIPAIDVLARHLVIAVSSKIFIHGEKAKAVLLNRFPNARAKCVTIPFGNWINQYQPYKTKEIAREYLNLPKDSFIYLLFGQCKPYKNIKYLIEVFRKNADKNDYLLIAGSFSNKSYLSTIKEVAGDDIRIRIDAKFIPDNEVSSYLCASDAMCMPYKEILTSGTAMLAISFGKPVLSINRGFLSDIITEDIGILIKTADEQSITEGLKLIKQRSWNQDLILNHASSYSFKNAAEIFLNEITSN